MYNDDIPEEIEIESMDKILIEDLQIRIESNTKRLKNKVDAKGKQLSNDQLANLAIIIKAQTERLEKMVKKYDTRRAKEASNSSSTGLLRKTPTRKKTAKQNNA